MLGDFDVDCLISATLDNFTTYISRAARPCCARSLPEQHEPPGTMGTPLAWLTRVANIAHAIEKIFCAPRCHNDTNFYLLHDISRFIATKPHYASTFF